MASKKNPRIKRANEMSEFTPERRSILARCARDPIYFIKNYVKVKHPVKGIIPFNLFPYQEEMVNNYVKHRFNIVTASRQVGKCVTQETKVTVLRKSNKFKMCLLYIFARDKYHEMKQIFKNH